MYLLQIIPIKKKLPEKYFSYLWSKEVSAGDLLEIDFHHQKILAICLDCKKFEILKQNIKQQNFILKKINKILIPNFLDKDFLKNLQDISILNATSESEILNDFLSTNFINYLLENKNILEKIFWKKEEEKEEKKENFILENLENRILKYEKIIEENLKNNFSTSIFFPTINDLKIFSHLFEKKYPENLLCFSSDLSPKKEKENYDKLFQNFKNQIPTLILSTPNLWVLILKKFLNLKSVILEKENSFNYLSFTSKIDFREIIKYLSLGENLEIFYAGNLFSLETFLKIKDAELKNLKSSLKKNPSKNLLEIIDLVKEKKEEEKEENKNQKQNIENIKSKYSKIYFSQKILDKLEEFKKQDKGKIFFYVKRKGLYTQTICRDCENVLKCKNCQKPLTLYEDKKNKEQRYFFCNTCKNKIHLKTEENLKCEICNGERLETFGIATEGLGKILKEAGFQTFILDSENISSKNKIETILENWRQEKLSILIGTDLAINNFTYQESVDFCCIISLDSLFSIPEINIDEKILDTIYDLKDIIKTDKIYIQTRLAENKIFKYLEEENPINFLEEEIKNRLTLSLPPYIKILKFKLERKNTEYKRQIERIFQKIILEENKPDLKIYWMENYTISGWNGIILIPKNLWEIKNQKNILASDLTHKLISLLSPFDLKIDGENLFK